MKLSLTTLLLLPFAALASTEVDSNSEANANRSGGIRRGAARGLKDGSGRSLSKGGKGDSSKGSNNDSKGGSKGGSKNGKDDGQKGSKGGKVANYVNPAPVNPAPVSTPAASPPTAAPPAAAADPSFTITDFVSSRSDLSTLGEALVRAGFSEPLRGSGAFTLFAPNNAAFAPIAPEFLNILFVDDDFIPLLQNLLLFHILVGKFSASDLVLLAGDSLVSANGENQPFAASPLTVGGVAVIEPDNDVTNGVVHVLDDVLPPSWVFNSISSRVNNIADLSILSQLLVLAGFDLSGLGGAFTLLAPTNTAFNALPAGALDFLADPTNLVELQTILVYHLILGIFTVAELEDGLQLPSALENATVVVSISGSAISFNQAAIGVSDILAVNGVVHKIGVVLNPNDSPTRR